MNLDLLQQTYGSMTRSTLELWEKEKAVGRQIGLPENYFKIGISLGIKFTPPPKLHAFLSKIRSLAEEDPFIQPIPEYCQHLTFLALSDHLWGHLNDIPQRIFAIRKLIENDFKKIVWRMSRFQLIPGPNFLLLAGYPDLKTWEMRQKIASKLLACDWREYVVGRYASLIVPFPPDIWHTTLFRYKYEFLSKDLRDFYEAHKNDTFEDLILGAPELRAVNYDWSYSVELK